MKCLSTIYSRLLLFNTFIFYTQNPNLRPQRQKKVTELEKEPAEKSKPQLTRREKEEIDKQKAKAHYQVISLICQEIKGAP